MMIPTDIKILKITKISFQVAYIDTEGTFRPDRIKAIAERFNVDADAALENIVVGRAHNSEHRKFTVSP